MGITRLNEMNAEEYGIWRKMLKYDDKYFSDMRYERKELRKRFGKIEAQDKNGTR